MPILSPKVKQRVKNLQNARGYDAIEDAIKGWVLDFNLPDATTPTSAISLGRRNYQEGTRKPSWRKQSATGVLNVNPNVTEPLLTSHIINCGHPTSSYTLMNGLEYQMPYEQDTNPWQPQPAAVSFIKSSWGDANMAIGTRQRQPSQILHNEDYPLKNINFGRNVTVNMFQTIGNHPYIRQMRNDTQYDKD
ncbi:hypothetical protein BGX38DRAFT_1267011 [Terfezia claveryi]|nr:hypothetical protein BGX38DRAFT_1267011 [Terfezia claveryi]